MIDGGLFTRDFLIEGITLTPVWNAMETAKLSATRLEVDRLFSDLRKLKSPNEAVTEKDLIYPLLKVIGWGDLVHVQPNASVKGRKDVPDALLFADDDARNRARLESDDWKRFKHGLCVVEAKRWNRVLDREEKGAKAEEGVPVHWPRIAPPVPLPAAGTCVRRRIAPSLVLKKPASAELQLRELRWQ